MLGEHVIQKEAVGLQQQHDIPIIFGKGAGLNGGIGLIASLANPTVDSYC